MPYSNISLSGNDTACLTFQWGTEKIIIFSGEANIYTFFAADVFIVLVTIIQ